MGCCQSTEDGENYEEMKDKKTPAIDFNPPPAKVALFGMSATDISSASSSENSNVTQQQEQEKKPEKEDRKKKGEANTQKGNEDGASATIKVEVKKKKKKEKVYVRDSYGLAADDTPATSNANMDDSRKAGGKGGGVQGESSCGEAQFHNVDSQNNDKGSNSHTNTASSNTFGQPVASTASIVEREGTGGEQKPKLKGKGLFRYLDADEDVDANGLGKTRDEGMRANLDDNEQSRSTNRFAVDNSVVENEDAAAARSKLEQQVSEASTEKEKIAAEQREKKKKDEEKLEKKKKELAGIDENDGEQMSKETAEEAASYLVGFAEEISMREARAHTNESGTGPKSNVESRQKRVDTEERAEWQVDEECVALVNGLLQAGTVVTVGKYSAECDFVVAGLHVVEKKLLNRPNQVKGFVITKKTRQAAAAVKRGSRKAGENKVRPSVALLKEKGGVGQKLNMLKGGAQNRAPRGGSVDSQKGVHGFWSPAIANMIEEESEGSSSDESDGGESHWEVNTEEAAPGRKLAVTVTPGTAAAMSTPGKVASVVAGGGAKPTGTTATVEKEKEKIEWKEGDTCMIIRMYGGIAREEKCIVVSVGKYNCEVHVLADDSYEVLKRGLLSEFVDHTFALPALPLSAATLTPNPTPTSYVSTAATATVEDELPDLQAKDVQKATGLMQKMFFKKKKQQEADLVAVAAASASTASPVVTTAEKEEKEQQQELTVYRTALQGGGGDYFSYSYS